MSPVHTSPPSCNGNLAFICWGANSTDCSHISALAQVGLWVPTPDAERSSQSSCELLARLQEFASTGSSACLVHKQPGFVAAVIEFAFCIFFCVCVCVCIVSIVCIQCNVCMCTCTVTVCRVTDLQELINRTGHNIISIHC